MLDADTLRARLFPSRPVAVASVVPGSEVRLRVDEAWLVTGAVAERRQQFAAGRAAARSAMHSLGVASAPPLGADADGVPLWPPGVVGSIAHTARRAVAAVARVRDVRGIGVDVEALQVLEPNVAVRISSPAERATLGRDLCPSLRELAPLVAFSAKEAGFKALYPVHRVRLALDEVVAAWQPEEERVTLELPPALAAHGLPSTMAVRALLDDGHVTCGAWLEAGT